MTSLDQTLDNEIVEFIALLEEARTVSGYRSKVWAIQSAARRAQDWAFYWEEKFAKWSE